MKTLQHCEPGTALMSIHRFSAGCLLAWALLAATTTAGAQQPGLTLSDDGATIVDNQTSQAWSRCLEGARWDGQACIGSPRLATHAEALALARARSTQDGQRWRLPRVKELQLFTKRVARIASAPDPILPPAPGEWLWTDSANIDTRPVNQYEYKNIERGVTSQNANSLAFLHGWAVNQQTGAARGDVPKRSRLPVRLVRSEN